MRRSAKERGSAWKFLIVFSAVFLAMAFGLLAGTGVFRNWGKRGLEEDADRALYKAVGKLLAGDTTDMSATFPPSIAGKSAAEIYSFLRADAMAKPKIEESFAKLERLAITAYGSEAVAEAKRALAELRRQYDDRQDRAARMTLRLKAWAPESDRLTRQYLKIARAFEEPAERAPEDKTRPPDESDNLFGGPNRIMDLQASYGETLMGRFALLARNRETYDIRYDRGAQVRFSDPKGAVAADFALATAKLERIASLIRFYSGRMESAVGAERRGLQRSLGL